jgi:hypothetical protein
MHSKLMIVKVKAINYVQAERRGGRQNYSAGGFLKDDCCHTLVMMGSQINHGTLHIGNTFVVQGYLEI